jgi:hypothetical protein
MELTEDGCERSGGRRHRLAERAKLRSQACNTRTRGVIKVTIGKEIQARFETVECKARGCGVDNIRVFGIGDDKAKRVIHVGC